MYEMLKPGTLLINDFLFKEGGERVKRCAIYNTKFMHDGFSCMMIWRKRISYKREGIYKRVPLVGRVGNDAKVSSGSKAGPTAVRISTKSRSKATTTITTTTSHSSKYLPHDLSQKPQTSVK